MMVSEAEKDAIRRKLKEVRTDLFNVAHELDQDEWTHPVYSHDADWSALDLLRHLTWAERSMLRLMKHIREGGEGASADFDLDRYNAAGVRKLSDKMPAELMQIMDENRSEVLAFIDQLADGDWSKKGRHGSQKIMTIEQIMHRIADHERQHLDDLRRALGQI